MRRAIVIPAATAAAIALAIGGAFWLLRPPPQLLSACAETAQCGYIDTEGKVVIDPVYSAAGDWAGDIGRVWRGNLVGSIDRNGRTVTPPQYAGINFNAGGSYSVPVNGKLRLTDHALRALNPELWDELFGVKLNRRLGVEPEYIVVGRGGLFGLADGKGRVILAPKYQEIGWRANSFPLLFKEGEAFGHLAENGQPISGERWAEAGLFYNKRASVTRDGKCGYVDPAGALAIPLGFDECRPFFHPDAAIVRHGPVFALIDRRGRIIKDDFEDAALAAQDDHPIPVRVQGKWGAVDAKGNFAIKPVFDAVEPLTLFGPEREVPVGVLTVAYAVKVQGRVGIMDFDGKWILPPLHDEVDNDYNGDGKLATYRNGALWGFVDLETRKATPPLWHQIKVKHRAALLPVRDGKKWGYADAEGIMRIAARYDQADELSGDWASVMVGQRYGLIDSEGREVAPAVFRTVYDVFPERARVMLVNSRGWVTRKGRLMGISEDDIKRAGLRG
jgi:hypothetical protein